MSDPHFRVAVVGAGPSGFYTTEQLLGLGFEVHLFDALPTPFGLVRSGVAPDHPKIKTVTRVYEKTAARAGFHFFGGVELGNHVSREDLLERYDAVVYAVGMSDDRRLGIPGEDSPGSHPATHFVAWYNAHAHFAEHEFDLSCDTAVVIGNGNVATDLARMLVLSPAEISVTDTADHAAHALADSAIRRVIVLGRRGPVQAAFTSPELRELGELSRADVIVDPADMELDSHSAAWLESDAASPATRRNVELLRDYAAREPHGHSHQVELRFLRSPVEILTDEGGRTRSLVVVRNRLEPDAAGRLQAVPTDEHEVIDCGLVLRSIGYRGRAISSVPFDHARGLISNQGGRVVDDNGHVMPGEYVVGWIKRGPVGVIGTNKKDAADTVARIVEDVAVGAINVPSAPGDADTVAQVLSDRAAGLIRWDGWIRIDAHERGRGEALGRPRVKLVSIEEMIAIGQGGASDVDDASVEGPAVALPGA
jgi:ferredoxin/flavodoxin---NADP+ reductase